MHEHHHDHAHPEDGGTLSTKDKLRKMFDHWVKHNQSHTETYRQWASQAAEAGLPETARLLEEVADLTVGVTEKLNQGPETMR